ncbi:uncharacterized protein ARMOST_11009 [Armillaria ostoyae]|uniref:Uncharacterized protein n=1 Tax=Armillaria ostoyae TaxID=47428 RepID=A0A284RFX5_ARMOS|nr:uncharacterized protein ARMOST_11009 [Armillaria ostoyae]
MDLGYGNLPITPLALGLIDALAILGSSRVSVTPGERARSKISFLVKTSPDPDQHKAKTHASESRHLRGVKQ